MQCKRNSSLFRLMETSLLFYWEWWVKSGVSEIKGPGRHRGKETFRMINRPIYGSLIASLRIFRLYFQGFYFRVLFSGFIFRFCFQVLFQLTVKDRQQIIGTSSRFGLVWLELEWEFSVLITNKIHDDVIWNQWNDKFNLKFVDNHVTWWKEH